MDDNEGGRGDLPGSARRPPRDQRPNRPDAERQQARAGRHATAANRIVRPLFELGGNEPFIVLDDADIDAAVEGAMLARFRNTGQSCVGANRFLVQSGVYDEFLEKFGREVEGMTVGHGLADPCPDLGPVIDDARAGEIGRAAS